MEQKSGLGREKNYKNTRSSGPPPRVSWPHLCTCRGANEPNTPHSSFGALFVRPAGSSTWSAACSSSWAMSFSTPCSAQPSAEQGATSNKPPKGNQQTSQLPIWSRMPKCCQAHQPHRLGCMATTTPSPTLCTRIDHSSGSGGGLSPHPTYRVLAGRGHPRGDGALGARRLLRVGGHHHPRGRDRAAGGGGGRAGRAQQRRGGGNKRHDWGWRVPRDGEPEWRL